MQRFGNYIVYVDESGDHSLSQINSDYPRFVLAFCIFPVADYVETVVPAVQRLKFQHFGHDMVVFHEHEIRKSEAPFQILVHKPTREAFLGEIDRIVETSPFTVVATVIRKEEFKSRRGGQTNPYDVALEFGLERVFSTCRARASSAAGLAWSLRAEVGRRTRRSNSRSVASWTPHGSAGWRTPLNSCVHTSKPTAQGSRSRT